MADRAGSGELRAGGGMQAVTLVTIVASWILLVIASAPLMSGVRRNEAR
jgi:hypothetical protein